MSLTALRQKIFSEERAPLLPSSQEKVDAAFSKAWEGAHLASKITIIAHNALAENDVVIGEKLALAQKPPYEIEMCSMEGMDLLTDCKDSMGIGKSRLSQIPKGNVNARQMQLLPRPDLMLLEKPQEASLEDRYDAFCNAFAGKYYTCISAHKKIDFGPTQAAYTYLKKLMPRPAAAFFSCFAFLFTTLPLFILHFSLLTGPATVGGLILLLGKFLIGCWNALKGCWKAGEEYLAKNAEKRKAQKSKDEAHLQAISLQAHEAKRSLQIGANNHYLLSRFQSEKEQHPILEPAYRSKCAKVIKDVIIQPLIIQPHRGEYEQIAKVYYQAEQEFAALLKENQKNFSDPIEPEAFEALYKDVFVEELIAHFFTDLNSSSLWSFLKPWDPAIRRKLIDKLEEKGVRVLEQAIKACDKEILDSQERSKTIEEEWDKEGKETERLSKLTWLVHICSDGPSVKKTIELVSRRWAEFDFIKKKREEKRLLLAKKAAFDRDIFFVGAS